MARSALRMLVVASCVVPLACGGDGAADPDTTDGVTTTLTVPGTETDTTTPPTPSTTPTTSTATTTSVATTTSSPSTPTSTLSPADAEFLAIYESATPVVDDGATCDLGWSELAGEGGEVTFARGGDLFSFDAATGEVHCLAQVDRQPNRLDWNPAGDRLLVDEDLVVTAEGPGASGFAPTTAGVSWSKPRGTALIAPSPDGTALRHVNAADPADETEVGSLATTWAASYHPSGLAIVSAGIDGNGVRGLFLADNTGADVKTLVFLEDAATTITEVAFSANGEYVTFVHDHTNGTIDEGVAAHIHRILLDGLVLEDIAALVDVVPTALVASEQGDGSIAWQQARSASRVETRTSTGDDLRIIGLPDTIVRPVGFFGNGTLAAVVAPAGQDDGAQLWVFPGDGAPLLIARDVTAATTRTIHDSNWTDPPIRIDQEAVG